MVHELNTSNTLLAYHLRPIRQLDDSGYDTLRSVADWQDRQHLLKRCLRSFLKMTLALKKRDKQSSVHKTQRRTTISYGEGSHVA